MKFVISPAKSLDFDAPSNSKHYTSPHFISDAARIIEALKKKSVKKLMDLQGISLALAELNYERNQNWLQKHDLSNSKQAISAFSGDVYVGINESDFDESDYEYIQDHLRILSGLYGLLRPLDIIHPYRLEMGTSLSTTRGKNLYDFWKLRITNKMNEELATSPDSVLINLASDEYFKVIKPKVLQARIIQPIFYDKSKGQYKVISFFAKKARGMMVRFATKNKISNEEDLKEFKSEGYSFEPNMSEGNKWVFTRES
ncbi:MAG: peroxide stress protein YaaA [Flavobacteriales bacterium]|nr:peroxide stress protein YaaA [Flavobacteriales bacterium]